MVGYIWSISKLFRLELYYTLTWLALNDLPSQKFWPWILTQPNMTSYKVWSGSIIRTRSMIDVRSGSLMIQFNPIYLHCYQQLGWYDQSLDCCHSWRVATSWGVSLRADFWGIHRYWRLYDGWDLWWCPCILSPQLFMVLPSTPSSLISRSSFRFSFCFIDFKFQSHAHDVLA